MDEQVHHPLLKESDHKGQGQGFNLTLAVVTCVLTLSAFQYGYSVGGIEESWSNCTDISQWLQHRKQPSHVRVALHPAVCGIQTHPFHHASKCPISSGLLWCLRLPWEVCLGVLQVVAWQMCWGSWCWYWLLMQLLLQKTKGGVNQQCSVRYRWIADGHCCGCVDAPGREVHQWYWLWDCKCRCPCVSNPCLVESHFPSYLAEIAPLRGNPFPNTAVTLEVRGSSGTLNQLAITIGVLVAQLLVLEA